MSSKEQRRQKKLAKKRSKVISEQKARAREKNSLQSVAGQMKAASSAAIDRCLISKDLLDPERRLGSVMIIRRISDGRFACARFLVDGMCLGVKEAEGFVFFPAQLSELLVDFNQFEEMRRATPAAARKLVEGAIAFAGQFDLPPCEEYRKVAPIWGDIDPQEHVADFQFGDKDGKPVYVMAEKDTMITADRIVAKLLATAGEGNFDVNHEALFASEEEDEWMNDPELDADIDEDVVEMIDSEAK